MLTLSSTELTLNNVKNTSEQFSKNITTFENNFLFDDLTFKMKTNHFINLHYNCTDFIAFSYRIVPWMTLKACAHYFLSNFYFYRMIPLQKLWKMLFISFKKLFSFSKYSNFCISIFPSFSPCQPML